MVLAHVLYSIFGQNQVLKYYWELNAIKTRLICLRCTISSNDVSRPDRIWQPGLVYLLLLFKDLYLFFSMKQRYEPR